MAGDWIKFRKKLLKDGRVLKLSRTCHAPVTQVLGALVTLWCLADDYAEENGLLPYYTVEDLEAELGIEGFLSALPPDWFQLGPNGEVVLPNYQEHNGPTARKRCQATERQRAQRERKRETAEASRTCHAPVTHLSQKCHTREEKRREEKKNTPLPPKGEPVVIPPELDVPTFRDAWERWLSYRRQINKSLKAASLASLVQRLAKWVAKWGMDAVLQTIENSIANGYQGLFEPKPQPASQPTSLQDFARQIEAQRKGNACPSSTPSANGRHGMAPSSP